MGNKKAERKLNNPKESWRKQKPSDNPDLRILKLEKQIEELRKVEKAFLISETRLRRAEFASKSGNWELHLDTGMIIGSEGAMKLYGITRSPVDYMQIKDIPLEEYRPMLDKALKDMIEHDKPYNIEFKIRNATTGEIFDKKNRILFGSIQDITDRKKAEEEIRKKNLELAQLLEITLEILETVDRKRIVKKIVEGGTRLIGMDTGAVYMIQGDDLILEATTPPIPEEFPDEFRKARLEHHPFIKQAVSTNMHYILSDAKSASLTQEERRIVEMRDLNSILFIPLVAHKDVVGVLILGSVGKKHDFREHEIDLSRTLSTVASLSLENSFLFENLTVAKNKAEESDRLKTAFLHNISHEIRTPMNAIIGFSGFLDQPGLSINERKEYIDIIFQSNNQLLRIINDILSISHVETGQVKVQESRIDLMQLMEHLYRLFRPEAEKKGIDFRMNNTLSGEEAIIFTDESKLTQIITNLVNNAVKFTHRGFIELGCAIFDNNIGIYVEDSGIGIPEEEHERIFDSFYQVDKTVSRIYSGTGLGLTISNAYAGLLGGKLSLISSPGKGSRFTFALPLKRIDDFTASSVSFIREKKEEAREGRTILIAEDEESNFALIMAMLKPAGYNLLRVKDGLEAIDTCRKNPDIDLILMDIKMPVINGCDAAFEILKFRQDLPIIAQTAYAHPDDRIRAIECGCADYIAKPFNREQLMSLIKKYIK
jgi:PAS domain S-box-containing protein